MVGGVTGDVATSADAAATEVTRSEDDPIVSEGIDETTDIRLLWVYVYMVEVIVVDDYSCPYCQSRGMVDKKAKCAQGRGTKHRISRYSIDATVMKERVGCELVRKVWKKGLGRMMMPMMKMTMELGWEEGG